MGELLQDKKYIEQYQRVKRWYKRLEQITKDREHDMTSDNYQDEVYAFFVNCYHLKDWIFNDLESGINKKTVEDFVEKSKNLRICKYICLGSKHLRLYEDNDTGIKRRHFSINMSPGNSTLINVRYEIVSDKKSYDAFTLATECLNEWEIFLTTHSPEFATNTQLRTI